MLNGSGAQDAARGRRIYYALATMRVGLCLGLMAAFLTIMPFSSPAYAQLNPGNQLLNQFASGQIDVNELTRQITSTGNMSQLDAQTLVSNIIKNQGGQLSSLGDVVNGVMNGQLNPQTALGLSSLNELGNISNLSDMSKVLNNPLVKQGLQSALNAAGLGEVSKQLGSIFSASGTQSLVSNLLTQAGMSQQAAQLISTIMGSAFTDAMGGIEGIMNALLEGLSNALGAQAVADALNALLNSQEQQQQNANNSGKCDKTCTDFCTCHDPIVQNHKNIRAHMTNEFEAYRTWLVSTWYITNMVPALMIMTNQMTTVALQQIEILGTFLDAKHQLETQRLFQQLTARAHKDYQPSEGMCEFGTATRSLAASERRADLGQVAFSQRQLKRQLGGGDVLTKEGELSDRASRLNQFLNEYCDKYDNGIGADNKRGLEALCKKSIKPERKNKDIDYTRTIDSALTLDVDFTKPANTDDEKDIFALTNNLYAHEAPEKIVRTKLASSNGDIRPDGYPLYMDLRAITAKRSVAQSSMTALASMKSKGAAEVAPFIKKFVEEIGLDKTEINKLIGDEPSYFAQMEVLTKIIYENPNFYADLYDKPVNVERKIAAMEAVGLMQDRDIYKSLLRSEAILAVYLETMLTPEQDKVSGRIMNAINGTDDETLTPDNAGAGNSNSDTDGVGP